MRHNKYKCSVTSKLLLHTGKVLCDVDEITNETVMYLVAGVSYDEAALVRLFGQNSMNAVLAKKCCRLSGKVMLPKSLENVTLPLYADITSLIRKTYLPLIPLLEGNNSQYIFKIAKRDINHIISCLKSTNTISEAIKSKYLSEIL